MVELDVIKVRRKRSDFHPKQNVVHVKYGPGKVLSVYNDPTDRAPIYVDFGRTDRWCRMCDLEVVE